MLLAQEITTDFNKTDKVVNIVIINKWQKPMIKCYDNSSLQYYERSDEWTIYVFFIQPNE